MNWKNGYGAIGPDGEATGVKMTPRQHRRWRKKTRRAQGRAQTAPPTRKKRRFSFMRRRRNYV